MARLLKEPPVLRLWLDQVPNPPLTDTELEVLRLNALGYTWEQVGEIMFCAVTGIQSHWGNITAKMDFAADTPEKGCYRLRAALWFQYNYWQEDEAQ